VICETTDIQIGTHNISNYSGRKTAVQLLKELRYSDSVVILITRHKSQKGLAAYEHLKEVMQHEGLNRFVNALKQISKASGDYNNNDKPSDYNNHDVPDDYKALKEQQEVAPTFVNAFDSLEVFPDESSYVLGEHDQNILETDDQNKKAKGEKKDDQKEEVMG
ncbi:830_t:CDS:2, partial [Gigaspora rosea]